MEETVSERSPRAHGPPDGRPPPRRGRTGAAIALALAAAVVSSAVAWVSRAEPPTHPSPRSATPTVAAEPSPRSATPTVAAEPSPRSAMPTIEDAARALAEAMTPRWEGPRVPWPETEDRPGEPLVSHRSRYRPVAVHAGPDVSPERLAAALDALEIAHDALCAAGLAPPYPDGGRGGDAGFDLYLVPPGALALPEPSGGEGASEPGSPAPASARAAADGSVAFGALDAVTSFALVDAEVDADALPACVAMAYADALLLARDPAERRDARRAMGAFLARGIAGRFGCDDGVADAQAAPSAAPFLGAPGDGEGGALFLARLSRTHDGGSGAFTRALFELARQRTADGGAPRALPDVPLALERTLERAGQDVRATMIDYAIDRYLAAPGAEGVPRIEPEWRIARGALPAHPGPSRDAIEVFGAGYAEVDVRGAPRGSRLRVWLRGEYGVDWSLVGVTLDARGAERSRITAPPGTSGRRSYAAIELDPETERVLVVVTNLGRPGASASSLFRATGVDDRRYELVFDLARDDGAIARDDGAR